MKLIVFITILYFLFSCSNGKSKKGTTANPDGEVSLFNLAHFFNESEQNLSFPVWFNDSIIRNRGVLEIVRSIYDDTTEIAEEQSLKKKIIYKFSNLGHLVSMNVSNHYDNKVISSVNVYFDSYDNQTGYSKTTVNDNSEYNHQEFPFIQYSKGEENENYFSFKDSESMRRLFIVKNKHLWKALTIDTLCDPDEIDLIIYGSYLKPIKKYQVKNLVEELNVRDYSYKGVAINEIDWKDDPFKINRRYRYSQNGNCIGFVETIYGMEKYVSAMHYDFQLKNNLPQKVAKKLYRNNLPVILSVDVFEYKFR